VTRSLLTTLLLTVLLLGVAAPLAGAQGAGNAPQNGESPPTELWDEFPLKQPAPGSTGQDGQAGAPAPGSGPQSETDDGSPGTIPLLLAGLVGLAVLGLALRVGIGIRHRRSLPAATGRAALALPVGSLTLADAGKAAAEGPTPSLPAPKTAAGREAQPAPAAKAAAARGAEAASAAKAPAGPKGPPAPAPEEPTREREAPDETDKSDGIPVGAPISTAAPPEDGRVAAIAPEPGPGPRPSVASQRAVGYASVSAADDLNNAELKVQVRLIQEACQRRGLTLVKIVRDVESHASSDLRRPGLTYALDRLAARDASCLVVSSLERLTRTAANLGALLGWLTECDARLVVIDLDLDTGTEEGQLGARALATVGGLERRKLEERTRKGLEAARHMRRSGRPAVSDRPSLKQRIADMRAQGMTLQAIADTLNAEGVPTLRGGAEWRPSSVQAAAGYKRPRRKSVLQAPAPPRDKRA
jgi:DNA invertase Pin-like site-specific DNA recombinase